MALLIGTGVCLFFFFEKITRMKSFMSKVVLMQMIFFLCEEYTFEIGTILVPFLFSSEKVALR